MKKSRIFLIVSIIITLFIFSSSLKDSNISSGESGRFLNLINSVLGVFSIELSHATLRKLAHFAEFSALGVSLSLTGLFSQKGIKKSTALILLTGFLISATDELLQFIPIGRSPQISDVFLDFSGILTGYIFVFTFFKLWKKRRKV